MHLLKLCKWSSVLFATVAYALPPPIPSGGIIERQLEKEYEAEPLELEKPMPPVEIDIPEERLKILPGMTVHIDTIEIRGNVSISSREIEGWIQGYLHKDLNLQQIYDICDRIDAGYASQGYIVARAYPPPQSIQKGLLILEVVEGKIGKVKVEGNHFYSQQFIQSYFERLLGRPLNYNEFMRALLLLNENSDLKAGAILSKGQEVGTVDIQLLVEDKWPGHLYWNANNMGRNLTTNWRAGGRFDVGSLLTYGDKLSVAEVLGFPFNALYFTDVIYSLPMNRDGLKMDLSYLFSRFKVEELQALKLSGNSQIGTVKMTQAIMRKRTMSIDVASWFDYMQIENLQMGSMTSFDKLRVLRASMTLDHFATPQARDYFDFIMGVGIPSFLGGLAPVDSECSRQGAGGRFVKFNTDYDRLQQFWFPDLLFTFHFTGQWSPYRLAVAEQLYLGGADTVRGYPLAVAVGDSGYYGNFEIHFPPPFLANYRFFLAKQKWREVFQIVGFFDQGGVFLHGGQTHYETGIGIGFRLNNLVGLFSLSLDVGFPLVNSSLSSGAVTYIKVTGCPF